MNADILLGASAVLAFGASTAFEIELPNATHVSPASAFGAALAAVAVSTNGVSPVQLLLVALAIQLVIVGAIRRKWGTSAIHGASLAIAFGFVLLYDQFGSTLGRERRVGLVFVVIAACLIYFAIDQSVRTARETHYELRLQIFIGRARAAAPLAVVLASTSGLIVLVLPLLGWMTFVVMFVPVLVCKHEFARWGQARRTYGETVRTLADLAEGAGYVAQGHSSRVAQLCVRIGQELALPPHRIQELELVGLLHDVGAVSLSDPSDLASVSSESIAESTGHLLKETEYLSRYAEIVLEVARGGRDVPLEGRILRVADAFDAARGSTVNELHALNSFTDPEYTPVVAALRRVLIVS